VDLLESDLGNGMKIFFLVNPSVKKKEWDYRELSAQVAKRYGWVPRFGEIDRKNPNSMDQLLRQAWEEDCRRVGVLGGDGTLQRVVTVLQRQKRLSGMEIAPLPAGTCNDFARYLGYTRKRLEEALRHACTGKAEPADLGSMDGELFLNNAGIGRRPVIAALPGGRPMGGRSSRPLQTLKNFRPIPMKAVWEKGSIEGTFYMALACNAPFFSGGLHFSKKPSIQDGLLDIYFMPTLPKWRLFTHLVFGRLGKPVRPRQLITIQVKQVEIQADADLWPQADGEPPARSVRRVIFSVAPEKAMIVR
jgi:diacylglycerol kinase (ATP)